MNELRDETVTFALLKRIKEKVCRLGRPVRIMEVCGTHTMTVYRYGLKPLLEEIGVSHVSGPGCPVCITPNHYHEIAIDLLTKRPKTIIASFGDMTRVPTRLGSLQTAVPTSSSQLKIVYSPTEALDLASRFPDHEVIFFGAGFETTIPSIALSVKKAHSLQLKNFSLLAALWLIPPALRAILESGEIALDGFLYPGHVSTIIGSEPYRFVAEEFRLAGCITGFEPNDVLLGILSLTEQLQAGQPEVAIEYRRAVSPEGNPKAKEVIAEVFAPRDAFWRGLGLIPRSSLELKPAYEDLDTLRRFGLSLSFENDLATSPCRCGEVLRGLIPPSSCPLFATACRPENPYGPCMVSYEGACLIYFKYNRPRSAS